MLVISASFRRNRRTSSLSNAAGKASVFGGQPDHDLDVTLNARSDLANCRNQLAHSDADDHRRGPMRQRSTGR
ncbi:hypothetical protein C3477_07670 [Mycobacterium kansasii]|nr:hypothetical protein C3B43_15000 [Mycobacterium kansasii]POY07390.1 hypothetical protein C3477_07670 [Mycobacterium kansasii]POY19105.1 hypothetical protein C3476_17985 [Mycobacterium kansasii]